MLQRLLGRGGQFMVNIRSGEHCISVLCSANSSYLTCCPGIRQTCPRRWGWRLCALHLVPSTSCASLLTPVSLAPLTPVGLLHNAAQMHRPLQVVTCTHAAGEWVGASTNMSPVQALPSPWMSPMRMQLVDGHLACILSAEGGAVTVAAGDTFCLALCSSGKVIVWGEVPANSAGAAGPWWQFCYVLSNMKLFQDQHRLLLCLPSAAPHSPLKCQLSSSPKLQPLHHSPHSLTAFLDFSHSNCLIFPYLP